MKIYNLYKKTKQDEGLTLISLILTIIIMVIIVGVSVNIGTESLNKTKLQGFYTELEIIQKRIDYIASTNENYNTLGSSLTSTQISKLNYILASEGSGLNLSTEDFRYFTTSQLESALELSDMKYNVFVDFDTRTVIAEEGIEIDDKFYHLLNNKIYYVELDNSKNDQLAINSLKFNISRYEKVVISTTGNTIKNTISTNVSYEESNKYKITVTPTNNIGEKVNGGTLKYKKSTNKYWEDVKGLEFIVSELTEYDVMYEDNNRNKIEVRINVWLNNTTPMIDVL